MEDYYWDIANETKMGRYLTRKEWKFIESFLKSSNIVANCLDVTCGSGRFTIPISQCEIAVVAVDYDLLPIRKLKENLEREPISVIRGEAHKLPFKESCFDCIVSIQTIDYCDARIFLKECRGFRKTHQ